MILLVSCPYGNLQSSRYTKFYIYIYIIYIYIYINNIFLFVDEAFLSNYANDTALYSIHKNHISNQSVLKQNFICLQKWFYENYMVLNPGKFCYMTFGSKFNNNDLLLEDGTTITSAE